MNDATPDAGRLFELMIEPCRRPLWTFLLRRVGDRAHAEDLYQETLLRAWRALPTYTEGGRLLSWLFRIAHNVVRDEGRRQAARPSLVGLPELPEVVDTRRADDRVEASQTRERLNEGLRRLTEEQLHVFLLRMHSDLTFQQIAELTEAPLSTVLNRMRDALRKLDSAMETD